MVTEPELYAHINGAGVNTCMLMHAHINTGCCRSSPLLCQSSWFWLAGILSASNEISRQKKIFFASVHTPCSYNNQLGLSALLPNATYGLPSLLSVCCAQYWHAI